MIRKNKTFLDWMHFIKSVHYASAEASFITNVKNSFESYDEERSEDRMKHIGRNGNNGEHYE